MTPRHAADPTDVDAVEEPAGSAHEGASAGDDALADAGLGDDALADAGLGADGAARPARRASLAHRLYNGEAGLDVVGRSRLIYRITAVVLLICLASIIFRGFNFGIEFVGGTSFRVPGTSAELTQVRAAAENAGAQVSSAQVVGGNSILLRAGQLSTAAQTRVTDAVAQAAHVRPNQVSPQAVSAMWGHDITSKAIVALIVFLVAVVLFLAVRFQPKMALAAILALLHDILITAGIYSIVGFEVTPSTVIGLLTILGFSLYDTVVVFDKVDENTRGLATGARMTWGEAANLAVNQTLMRSINTSVIALLPVAGLLFVGAGLLGVGTLKDLALVLFVGLAAGTYSSIFLATPIVADLKEREPAQIALRKRVVARRAAAARQARSGAPVAVASARRGGGTRGSAGSSSVAVAERGEALPGRVEADMVIESPESVTPEVRTGGTAAPRPGQRPQRPGGGRSGRRSGGKRR
jgi:preprotein translocase subunit SecF